MFSRFFIDRPVFANVIAIITIMVGAVALRGLPIEQYPQITPPTVRVSTVYPGANAQVIADTVAAPIEQRITGVENMLYMSSTCSSDGSYSLVVTFDIGTNVDDAQVLVQNRLAIAMPQLPEEVRRQGVTAQKQSTNFVLVCALTSDNPRHDSLFLSNLASLRLRDELSRIPGVGEVQVFGGNDYSMRIWLDPQQLKARNMTTQDVISAVQEQNVQVAAGQIGQPPTPKEQNFQYVVTALGRLTTAEEFEKIVIKTAPGGRVTYLRDVAKVELGAMTYDMYSLKNDKNKNAVQSTSLGVFQLPGANAIEVGKQVHAAVERIAPSFPEGVKYDFPFDTTRFVNAAVYEVYKTLIETGILVLIVILIFLQDWRAVLIPATTVPVTIVGAFAAMYVLGFTVNLLTLFGIVLAIGIVVDDAIVIVEAAAHHVERGLPPREAAIRAMDQVLAPIIGITLVLMAVFLPTAFLGGITGQLYKQFALTIAATALISAINAITLKPMQCAFWLRKPPERRNIFARAFNWVYGHCEHVYVLIVGQLLRVRWAMMLLFTVLAIGTFGWYLRLPTGFIPPEDQGYFIIAVKLPDAASQPRTREVTAKINDVLKNLDGVADWFVIGGMSLFDNSNSSNAATIFVTFKSWEERKSPELSQQSILGKFQKKVDSIEEAMIFAFAPPPISGVGVSSDFKLQIEDRMNVGPAELQATVQELVAEASKQPNLVGINSSYSLGVPQLYIDVDRVKVKTLDIPLQSVFGTLQAYLGSAYVNDFNKFGRTYQVRLQADKSFRFQPQDIERLEVRNNAGKMIPLGAVVRVKRAFGPQIITRHNTYPVASIGGAPAPGYSSGQALARMEELANSQLPNTMAYEWTDMAYQEKRVGSESIWIFAFAVALVYLVLAAQYESWITPIAVILVVPLGLLGSVALVSFRQMDNNIYTQIGIVLIIALASKNAILIVEFAREMRAAGHTIADAAIQAARLRFRPILMTSFAFILGVMPLLFADGAGAAGQQALGTAVVGGMLTSTFLAVFFVPIFFCVFQHLKEWRFNRPVMAEAAHTKP